MDSIPSLAVYSCFFSFGLFKVFLNDVINLLRVVMHHICIRNRQSARESLKVSTNMSCVTQLIQKILYTKHFHLSDIQHPAAPIIFHYFHPFFDPLLCCPINFGPFSLFSFPERKKRMLFHPHPPFTNSFLLLVSSNSDQQQEGSATLNFQISPIFTAHIPQTM